MHCIQHGRKSLVRKQKISSKYNQLVKKCNNLHVSIKPIVQYRLKAFTHRNSFKNLSVILAKYLYNRDPNEIMGVLR